jgi:magnesium-transporting ATPase (P-type)
MKRPIRDGFFLVLRHHRLVWWIFFVNLLLGFFASLAPSIALHSTLDRSLYAGELSRRFDATVFMELLSKPEVSPAPWVAGSAVLGVIFLFYMIFLAGGILAVYREDRKLTRGQFFESCGDFFWRMVRVLLCSIIPIGIVFALLSRVRSVSGKMASNAPREMQGFWVQVLGTLLCLVLALFVRAWFDVAQARTVIERVRGMFKLSCRTFMLAVRNLPRLLSIYLTTTLVCALVAVAGWKLWLNIPHNSFGRSWLLLEGVTLVMVGIRLWQRAATVLWYENYAELHAAPVPLTPVTPPPPEMIQAAAAPAETLPTPTTETPQDS